MTLKNLLEIIDSFQDIQLVSSNTGEALSTVDYLEDSGFYGAISGWLDNEIMGIMPTKAKNQDCLYLRVMVVTKISEDNPKTISPNCSKCPHLKYCPNRFSEISKYCNGNKESIP